MKIFAISDLHLAISTDKPMDVFGGNWVDYVEKIKEDWNEKGNFSRQIWRLIWELRTL